MRRTLITLALVLVTFAIVKADDRPVTFNQLPQAVQTFINTNYPDEKVAFATVDDDFIRPDYHVALVSGVMLQFEHGGSLEKIETRNGNIPAGIIPFQIIDMVKQYYPEAQITEYEIGKRSYEVKLSNRMEMKFNTKFQIIELDD